MSFLKSLFGKKKEEESDGQEEYFRDDFAPVVKQPSKKKAEPKAKANENMPDIEINPTPAKKTTPKSTANKEKAADKPASKAKKPAEEKKAEPKPQKKSTASKPSAKPTAKSPAKAPAKPSSKPTEKKPTAKAAPKSAKSSELTDDSPEVKGAVAIKEGRDTANGKWDIRRAKDGRYFFSLYASNHTVIAYSQIYSSTTAVNTGIASVVANAPKCEIEDTTLKKPVSLPCPKWEIYIDKAGEYRFRLYAPNGLVVCHAAHGYASKSGCKGGIESIRRFCVEARVDKSYLK